MVETDLASIESENSHVNDVRMGPLLFLIASSMWVSRIPIIQLWQVFSASTHFFKHPNYDCVRLKKKGKSEKKKKNCD